MAHARTSPPLSPFPPPTGRLDVLAVLVANQMGSRGMVPRALCIPAHRKHNKLVTPGGGCEEQAKSCGGINRRKEKRKKEERKTVEGASRFVRRIVTQRRNDASVCADRVV